VALREKPRLRRIFFAGSTRVSAYQRISRRFDLVPRHVMVDTLASELPARMVRRLTESEDLCRSETSYANELTIAESHAHVIPYEAWLETLACSDFFLACPGQYMPMCHNTIESMAVGTIPITEYADYMHPSLEDGVNCITFRNKEELVKKVTTALKAPVEVVSRLRRGAAEYFDRHLRATSVIDKIRAIPDKELTLHVRAHEWPVANSSEDAASPTASHDETDDAKEIPILKFRPREDNERGVQIFPQIPGDPRSSRHITIRSRAA
jgi:hypothetical protein